MATYTDNLNLKLPAGTEQVSRQDLNANFQAVDNAFTDPDFTGSVSANRKSGSIQGTKSAAIGNDGTASGNYSFAEGSNTFATGAASHAENGYTTASGDYSHASGWYTEASALASSAEGQHTIANGNYSHVVGQYNVADSASNIPAWVAGTHYIPGNIVRYNNTTYKCQTENTDTTFTVSKWTTSAQKLYAEIVGSGFSEATRANARAMDWNGNEHLMGDLYVGCNADSTGGSKVAKASDVDDLKSAVDNIKNVISEDADLSNSYVPDYSITTNKSIGATIDLTPSSSNSFGYIIEECAEGDTFIIKGTGGDGPRLWAFIDSDNKLLLVADAYAYTEVGETITVTAPQNSAKIIYNAQKSATHKLAKVILINVSEALEDIRDDINDINDEIADLPNIRDDISDIQEEIDNFPDVSSLEEALVEYKYVDTNLSSTYVESKSITTNVGTGNTVSLTPNDSNAFGYIIADCKEGDSFTVKGTGGDGPRAWAFIDSSNKLLSAASSYAIMDYDDVTAPADSSKAIFNLMKSTAHKVTKHSLEKVPINIREINSDFNASEQMFNKDTIISGKKYDSGVITSDSNYYLSEYIAIKPNTKYTYRGLNGAINYFDIDKDYLSAESITSYDTATSKTSPTGAYYCRLQMTKLYYPYDALTMNEGDTGTKELIYGKLFDSEKIEKPQYRFSDIPIPTEYTAVGIKAVDGSSGTDFDNENPSLTDVYDAFDALVTEYPNYVSKEDFGTDQSGTYHIYAYYFNPESMEASSTYYRFPYPKINLLAGIHGSYECCENIFALYYLVKSLCENWRSSEALDYLRWNVRLAIMPIQNPYGFANKTRQNSRGVDLNRNFSIGWKSRESGTAEYGGTAPMSEAESNAIANFAEANKDALFTVDLHGTGNSAVNQSSMIYCGVGPTDDIYYLAKSLITKMSHYWDSLNISGLEPANFHGFIAGSIEGDGMQRAYMIGEKKIHAMVLESFKNFSSSPYSNNSLEIMQMIGDQMGYLLLFGLNHFRH